MAKPAKQQPNRQAGEAKDEAKPGAWSKLAVVVGGLLLTGFGAIGGAVVQDYFDVLKTNRELAGEYSKAASGSGTTVEGVVQGMLKSLTDAQATISDDTKVSLRSALLTLQNDTERLSIQTHVPDDVFRSYTSAMADLADKADATEGPADAKAFLSALSAFYVSKRNFEKAIAVTYKLPLT